LVGEGIDPKYAKILYANENSLIAFNRYKDGPGIDKNKLSSLIANKKIDIDQDIPSQYQKLSRVGITDKSALEAIVKSIVEANPEVVAEYKKGKTNTLGFFVGQVMKETNGEADPQTVSRLAIDLLSQA